MIGQAKSLGLFGSSPIFGGPANQKEKAEDSEEDESSDEEDDSTPAEFPSHKEECKMVLVVRTDLGMTKGTSNFAVHSQTPLTKTRQNRRAVRSRSTRLLQALPQAVAQLTDTEAMGVTWPGQGGTASQERGGDGVAAGASTESGTGGTYHTRRGADADCKWERNRAGHRPCAKECD